MPGLEALGLDSVTESNGVRARAGCSGLIDSAGVATTHQRRVNKAAD